MLILQRASAGSGKTYTLALTYIRLLISTSDGNGGSRLRTDSELTNSMSHILAVTFTNKATNEMKHRIIERLSELANDVPGTDTTYLKDLMAEFHATEEKIRSRCAIALRHLLNDYSNFQISTIDSFFQGVLRTFTYEAEISDNYQVELDSAYLSALAIETLLAKIDDDNRSASAIWLRRLVNEAAARGEKWNVFSGRLTLGNASRSSVKGKIHKVVSRMQDENFKRHKKEFQQYFALPATKDYLKTVDDYSNFIEKDLERAFREMQQRARDLEKAFETRRLDLESGRAHLKSNIKNVLSCKDKFELNISSSYSTNYDAISEASKNVLSGKAFKEYKQNETLIGELADAARNFYSKVFEFKRLADSKSIKLWRIFRPTLPYAALMHEADRAITEYLTDNNLVELSNTNTMLHRIIGRDETPFIYERIGTILEHYLIDEFQDTSELQYINLKPLLEESLGHQFENLIIGDAKQSIYRFRNADPSLITERVPSDFSLSPENLRGSARKENTNHRSSLRVVLFNNMIFSLLSRQLDSLRGYSLSPGDESGPLYQLYRDVEQYPANRRQLGFVSVGFDGMGHRAKELSPEETAAWKAEENKIAEKRKAESKRGGINRGPSPLDFYYVPRMIADLLERGYKMSEIAVLVNTNAQGESVVRAIMDYNSSDERKGPDIEFLSDESLKINLSKSVRTIIDVLTMIADGFYVEEEEETDPGKEKKGKRCLSSSTLSSSYALFLRLHPECSSTNALSEYFRSDDSGKRIRKMLEAMPSVTLPGLVEAICAEFIGAEACKTEAPFISAFQDCVLSYCRSNASNVSSFLDWWNTKSDKLNITSPEKAEAVQIMTIHKSKGLEFRCVIMPEVKFDFGPDDSKSMLWVEPIIPEAIKAGLPPLPPIMPVTVQSDLLRESPYKSDYDKYILEGTVDALDKLYVGFTRAVDELYVCVAGKISKDRNKYSDNVTVLRPILLNFADGLTEAKLKGELQLQPDDITVIAERGEFFEADCPDRDEYKNLFICGERLSASDIAAIRECRDLRKDENAKPTDEKKNQLEPFVVEEGYTSSATPANLKYRNPRLPLVKDIETDESREAGNAEHAIMESIITAADLDKAIRKAVTAGTVSKVNGEKIRQKLALALQKPEVEKWFDGSMRVINERSFIFPDDGETDGLRPDRLMFGSDGKAIVVDYKFGCTADDRFRKVHRHYEKQVRAYMKGVAATRGVKAAEGYIWYVDRDEIRQVEI